MTLTNKNMTKMREIFVVFFRIVVMADIPVVAKFLSDIIIEQLFFYKKSINLSISAVPSRCS